MTSNKKSLLENRILQKYIPREHRDPDKFLQENYRQIINNLSKASKVYIRNKSSHKDELNIWQCVVQLVELYGTLPEWYMYCGKAIVQVARCQGISATKPQIGEDIEANFFIELLAQMRRSADADADVSRKLLVELVYLYALPANTGLDIIQVSLEKIVSLFHQSTAPQDIVEPAFNACRLIYTKFDGGSDKELLSVLNTICIMISSHELLPDLDRNISRSIADFSNMIKQQMDS